MIEMDRYRWTPDGMVPTKMNTPLASYSIFYLARDYHAMATRMAAAEKELLEVKIQCGKNAMSHMGAYNLFRQAQAEATRLRAVLVEIAKPALGGKQQQYLAQAALAKADRDQAAERERLKDSQDGIDQRVAADPFNTQFRERAQ